MYSTPLAKKYKKIVIIKQKTSRRYYHTLVKLTKIKVWEHEALARMQDNKNSHTFRPVILSRKTVWYCLMRLSICMSYHLEFSSLVHFIEICMFMYTRIYIRMLKAAVCINIQNQTQHKCLSTVAIRACGGCFCTCVLVYMWGGDEGSKGVKVFRGDLNCTRRGA